MQEAIIRQAVASQYGAAFAMLRGAVTACPDELWDNPADKNRFWHVAYHALFYAHLYLSDSLEAFEAWDRHRDDYASMDAAPETPLSRDDVLVYCDVCEQFMQQAIVALDPAAPSGFHWLPMNKLELQFYNIRHIQLHTGELAERLSQRVGTDVPWVGRKA